MTADIIIIDKSIETTKARRTWIEDIQMLRERCHSILTNTRKLSTDEEAKLFHDEKQS